MKLLSVSSILVFSIMVAECAFAAEPAAPPAPAGAAPADTSGPKIQFATPVYDFGKVSAGEPVKHEYVFTNTGDALLIISNVQPSCGCTTAGQWTKQVEPGQTGVIPIQFNSGAYGGPVGKTITITSNDKGQRQVVLQLKGTIWKPIDVNPQFAMMNVPPDSESNVTTTVRIVNNMEPPLTLSEPESNNQSFTAELKTIQPGKEFQLLIKTVPPLGTGSVQGQITLKTSATNVPTLSVTAFANIQPAVTVSPAQIMLQTNPSTNQQTYMISIHNNSVKPLTLSEPGVNAKDVDVQMKETEPGRQFTLTLTFPAGFEIAQGESVELSVKSSHPQFQVIKVPVRQMPRPAQAMVQPIRITPGTANPVPPPPAPKSTQ